MRLPGRLLEDVSKPVADESKEPSEANCLSISAKVDRGIADENEERVSMLAKAAARAEKRAREEADRSEAAAAEVREAADRAAASGAGPSTVINNNITNNFNFPAPPSKRLLTDYFSFQWGLKLVVKKSLNTTETSMWRHSPRVDFIPKTAVSSWHSVGPRPTIQKQKTSLRASTHNAAAFSKKKVEGLENRETSDDTDHGPCQSDWERKPGTEAGEERSCQRKKDNKEKEKPAEKKG